MKTRRAIRQITAGPLPDPYREEWRALTPRERLRRSWALRKRIKNLEAVHDAKTIPLS